MKSTLILAILFITFSGRAVAQGTSGSNLPLILINTDNGWDIVDEPRVPADMKIIYRGPGERNYLSDQGTPAYLNYDGRIDIEVRGSSSQAFSKKPYGFSTRLSDGITKNNVSLLGMPEEHDWILNGMVYDTAMIRDYLCYNLSRQMGNYASRTAYCELWINNHYQGVYLLQEKIKADRGRVDVHKISAIDNTFPYVTGGYITKADKVNYGETVAWTMYTWYGAAVDYLSVLPKQEQLTSSQLTYIFNQFKDLETAAASNNISLEDGFPSLIDVPSFVDFMLLNELASNPDAYQYSTYFHKDRKGKLRAGPIWDSDLTFGNDLFFWGYDRSKPTGWQFQENWNDGSTFWRDLFYSDEFRCYLARRWNELGQAGAPFNLTSLEAFIDTTVAYIGEAVARDYSRWGIGEDHLQHVNNIKAYLLERLTWMTQELGSFAACSDVQVHPLVLNRINYCPKATPEFPESNQMEYIEILNNGDQAVDLTGIYFLGTGLSYKFPDNATLGPGASYHLASSWPTFEARYGFTPYGEFARHLSNQDEDLVLADGFGNIIDAVHYYSNSPWPDANGNGYHLALMDPDLDNSLPQSWYASNETLVSTKEYFGGSEPRVFPNPVVDQVIIEADHEIETIRLRDIQGRLLRSFEISGLNAELDMNPYQGGTYILEIISYGKTYSRLIVKL